MQNTTDQTITKSRGDILKEAREAKGLSLEVIHEATKIPMDVLRSIEEGYAIRNMSPFYLRGFLKIYANYLNVDPKLVMEDLKPSEPVKKYTVSAPQFDFEPIEQWFSKTLSRIDKKYVAIAVAVFFGIFLFSKFLGWLSHRPKTVKVSHQKEVTKALDKIAKKESGKTLEKSKEHLTSAKVAKTEVVEKDVVEPKAVTTPEIAMPVVASQVNKKTITVTARAKKNSWLKVLSDGEVVFQSTLASGSAETWEAENKIEISGKNINQLEFELNGKTIGTLGREDRKAKGVVITKNGLSVIR